MVNLSKSWTLKIFMILCIGLQSVALFPHHHHELSEAVCFNTTHCIEAHSDFRDHQGCQHSRSHCGNHSMQGHHHDTGHDKCSVNMIVVVKPSLERSDFLSVMSLDFDAHIPSLTPRVTCNSCYEGELSCSDHRDGPPTESIIINYIAKALSLKAPDHLS